MTALWNTADKSANITLSGGSLVATSTSAAQGAVRADTSVSSGKHIFTVIVGADPAGTSTAIGWANATASLGSPLGSDANSIAIRLTDGKVLFNGVINPTELYPAHNASVVDLALDITNGKIWIQIDGGPWNNSLTADPASNVGGISIAGIAAGPYFPAFASEASGQTVTGVFGAVQPIHSIPAGFSTLDTAVQSYEATPKFSGYAAYSNYENAEGAAKMLGISIASNFGQAVGAAALKGYSLDSNFGQAVGAAKLIGYGILQPFVPPPSTIQRTQGGIF